MIRIVLRCLLRVDTFPVISAYIVFSPLRFATSSWGLSMGRILTSYFKGFGQLSDPKTRSVIWTSIGLSAVVFIGVFIALYMVLKVTTFVTIGPLEVFFDFLGQAAVLVLTYFLFPAVVTAVGSLLLDKVVDAVEDRHYPTLPVAAGQTVMESIGPALRLLGVTVGYNILCLPLLFFPPLFFIVFWSMNGYLLSREYFELVAMRRISAKDAHALRKRWQTPLFIAGVGFAFMFTIPILNVITPVIATAVMVHLFEAWRAKDGVVDKPAAPAKGPAVSHASAKTDAVEGKDDVINLPGPDA